MTPQTITIHIDISCSSQFLEVKSLTVVCFDATQLLIWYTRSISYAADDHLYFFSGCGGEINLQTGQIFSLSSESYLMRNRAARKCIWLISAPSNALISK